MKYIKLTLFSAIIAAGIILSTSFSLAASKDYSFHTLLIYSFIKYTQWPPEVEIEEYTIGVLSDDPAVLRAFKVMAATKSINRKKIRIANFTDPSQVPVAQVIFIPEDKSYLFDAVLQEVSGGNVLLITEKEGLKEKGACINFVMRQRKPYFQINREALDREGLKVARSLEQLSVD